LASSSRSRSSSLWISVPFSSVVVRSAASALIGRLCEAELRRHGHSVSHATWGGNQTAKDGGLDVHVALPPGASISGFIPRPETGFQVKKPDMPRKEITEEMKPGGVVRPILADLAKASGAYVIVSATGSTAFSALKNRKAAMADAVDGMLDASKLALDFYDRNRVATWLRDHPGRQSVTVAPRPRGLSRGSGPLRVGACPDR
jgi:hypothetical protein